MCKIRVKLNPTRIHNQLVWFIISAHGKTVPEIIFGVKNSEHKDKKVHLRPLKVSFNSDKA